MNIAICGCGIGGISAAIFAQRLGFNVALFDQFEVPKPVGSGLVIQPVGLRVLEQLGAAKAALAKGAKGFRMLGHEAKSGRLVLDVSYGEKGGENFGLGIHRASLFGALMEVAEAEGIKVTGKHRVVSTDVNDQGRFLTFENGTSVGPFDLVIDTMGVGSPVSPLISKSLHYGAIWATVDWPDDCVLQYDCLQQRYRRASNMIGVLPIGTMPGENRRKAALFWSVPRTKIEQWQNSPIEEWRAEATNLWPELAPFTAQITDHSQMTPAVYSHGSLRKPFGDRILHIGDAAHRASPQLGQGANMALLDAAALMKCLKAFPLDQALSKYTKARRRHTNAYQAMSWAFTPMYQSNNRALPILRDYVLGPLSRIPPAPKVLSSLVKGTMINPMRGLPPM
ncbi:FAD-dependent oxidoreductase [Falsihalocynthiibacter arcticus]|uniref:Monooxygenase n=1 Tax=Falsihalocynthiibacter arcticus TaxID=1579316 RepID=A0A126V620_9RHOB|nr:NAD(P)/FAD-dependent oxidoreductase [Falsihalocynthiibacter arcticus]AML53791.1 monooxygenase [Falsihalocynthiibacter arcticus]